MFYNLNKKLSLYRRKDYKHNRASKKVIIIKHIYSMVKTFFPIPRQPIKHYHKDMTIHYKYTFYLFFIQKMSIFELSKQNNQLYIYAGLRTFTRSYLLLTS